MKLYEFEGKSIFQEIGIPVPRGITATNLEEAKKAASEVGYPVVVKSQVLRGGRGKAGGIKFAETEDELIKAVNDLLALQLSGEQVEKLLIEEKLSIAHEFYMGITLDPKSLLPILMISAQGGMDIELVAKNYPDQLHKLHLNPLKIPKLYQMIDWVLQTGLKGKELLEVAKVSLNLVNCYFKYNAITAEINPLVIDVDGKVIAADAKIEIDDAALFRLQALNNFKRRDEILDPLEAEAKAVGVSYVRLGKGNIGLIAGGAGLGMASMDMIAAHGGAPANFLDLGGDATMEKTAAALRIVLKTPGVEGVLINLFGGINNCEKMAMGISQVINEVNPPQAIVVKMRGHSQDEGWAILEKNNIPIIKYGTTEEAVILLLKEMNKKKVINSVHIG
ncbi:ADP-forming succinate--CoA ligase subunit beta [Calderihabitans maritimus]|uniref:Succinate-CoA ligase n=1 Tax=Calderihabitans maritimus TaxID=1246530 RepID=A0A1Z5HRU8_9FIRM|nr:ADP-forming succinate--CoA ligase subunit beta [Calderihabitans maritimus]GAW92249.1 succinate-CoA ligase [Calderihabitans maritimus]